MTELVNLHMMGTKQDLARRMKLRTDDSYRRAKVDQSIKLIYEDGLRVDTQRIEDLLREESWVPAPVSYFNLRMRSLVNIFSYRMHFQNDYQNMVLIYTACSCLIFCTNSIQVFGVPFSSIFCGSCVPSTKASSMN